MHLRLSISIAALCLVLVAPAAHALDATTAGVDWIDIKQGGSVEAAFARAKKENRPLFLYWGAAWCPPCNQVKATIFTRQDFIERAKYFVPVYVDGDAPAAQQLGGRFHVSAYPTMVLFRADGTELTRLPNEVDATRYMQVLAQAINGGRPARALLAQARAGKPMKVTEWEQLAFYAWDVDEQALLPKAERAATLWKLAQACNATAPDASARLALKAVMLAAAENDAGQAPPLDKAAALQRMRAVLAAPSIARANLLELSYGTQKLPPYLTEPNTAARDELLREWDRALTRLANNGALSRLDRVAAASGRVGLARVQQPKGPLPLALLTEVRGAALSATRDVVNPYEREAVTVGAAEMLADAGLYDDSDALLKAQMERSATPYYHMLGLASNARARGDNAAALGWYEKAYSSAQGPATRLQWGAIYVRALVDLAAADADRIEQAAGSVIGAIEPRPETFHGRNSKVLERMGARLAEWNKDGRHDAALTRLREQLHGVCTQLPAAAPERARCDGLLHPPA